MSVMLRDVKAICETHSFGKEIDGTLRPLHGIPRRIKNGQSCAFFLEAHRRNSGEVTDQEFVAFLLYWICKHLLCVSDKIVMEYLVLAACLAEERPLNLSGYLLSNLYSGMYHLISCLVRGGIERHGISCRGPIWLPQFWLHLYFPEFHFDTVSPKEATRLKGCYRKELVKIRPRGMSFQECCNVFLSYTRRDGDFFVLSEENERILECHGKDWEKLVDYYGNVLIPGGLPRAVIWKSSCRSYRVEVYCLHFCTRQFGLCQSITVPPLYKANVGFVDRVMSNITKPIEGVKLLNEELADCFGKEFFLFRGKPCTTPLFDNWWRTDVWDTLHPKMGSLLSKILVHNPDVYAFRCVLTHEANGQVEATQIVQTAEGSRTTPRAPVTLSSCPYQPTPVVSTILSNEEISFVRRKRTKTNKNTAYIGYSR